MNNEIKEILAVLKETVYYPKINYSSYDKSYNETIDNVAMIKSFACKQLLDYITNLQQENEDLKDYLDIFKLSNKTKQETIDDFRKRVDKAIEILKDTTVDMPSTLLIETVDYARHILTGGDE